MYVFTNTPDLHIPDNWSGAMDWGLNGTPILPFHNFGTSNDGPNHSTLSEPNERGLIDWEPKKVTDPLVPGRYARLACFVADAMEPELSPIYGALPITAAQANAGSANLAAEESLLSRFAAVYGLASFLSVPLALDIGIPDDENGRFNYTAWNRARINRLARLLSLYPFRPWLILQTRRFRPNTSYEVLPICSPVDLQEQVDLVNWTEYHYPNLFTAAVFAPVYSSVPAPSQESALALIANANPPL